MQRQDIQNHYIQRAQMLADEIHRLKKKNHLFIVSELLSFVLMIGCIVAYTSIYKHESMFLVALLFLIVYMLIRYYDAKNGQMIEEKTDLKSVYEKETAYMEGNYGVFDNGERYVNPNHPYTFDMDIFGNESLFQRMNRGVTTGGADLLAGELSDVVKEDSMLAEESLDAASVQMQRRQRLERVEARAEVIRELAENEPLRSRFLALGQRKTVDTAQVIAALKDIQNLSLSSFPKTWLSLVIACGAIIGFLTSIVLAIVGKCSINVPIWWGIIQFCVVYIINAHALRDITKVVNRAHKQLQRYVAMMHIISESDLKSREGQEMINTLISEEANAVESFGELKRILDGLDRRGNMLGMFLANTFVLSDYFLVRRFLTWQDRYMMRTEEWIGVVSRFDALVSMATFRYNEPGTIEATLNDSQHVVYRAQGIYHPFLGDKAVRNDFCVDHQHYYIITGANMAGKSTFLRSLGVNYILAMNGIPVFAERLEVSSFSLFSSMRTTDDLAHGISYFNAELLRLKQLISHCRKAENTLIILDEILKGTNSLDKLNGSKLFLEEIAKENVTGVIATHDLELSKMADERPDRFHNYCFEIRLSDEITYTYKITPGVARNQNATYLLKHMIAETVKE